MAEAAIKHFMIQFENEKAVAGKAFKEKGIERVRRQAREGAGWMVVTGDGDTVTDLIETGRRFQRMALRAREKMIAIHPMTQTLEEDAGRKSIQAHHHPELNPLFMLRVGYLDQYPDPVSLRRPVEWFVMV